MAEQTIGRRIKVLREERGWTQRQLGERCDLDHTAVSRIEHDRVRPTRRTLRDIARALGIPVEELTDGPARQ